MNNFEFIKELSSRVNTGNNLFDTKISSINEKSNTIRKDVEGAVKKLQRIFGTATCDLIRFPEIVLEENSYQVKTFAINEHGLCLGKMGKEDTSRKYYSEWMNTQQLLNILSDDEFHNKVVMSCVNNRRMKILNIWMNIHACSAELKILNRLYSESIETIKLIPKDKLEFVMQSHYDNESITKKKLDYMELEQGDRNLKYFFDDSSDGVEYTNGSVGHMLVTLQFPNEILEVLERKDGDLGTDYQLLDVSMKKIEEKLAPYTVVFTLHDSQR